MLHELKYFFEFNKFDDTIWNAASANQKSWCFGECNITIVKPLKQLLDFY